MMNSPGSSGTIFLPMRTGGIQHVPTHFLPDNGTRMGRPDRDLYPCGAL